MPGADVSNSAIAASQFQRLWSLRPLGPKLKGGQALAPSRTSDGVRRTIRDRARDGAVALVSVGVVAFLIAYALSSPSVEIDADVAAVEQHPGRHAVVHGRILEAGGDPVIDAEVRVERSGTSSLVAHSGERGFFRIDVTGACARHRIVVSVREQDHPVATTFRRRLCPGDAVEVNARLSSASQLVWAPIR